MSRSPSRVGVSSSSSKVLRRLNQLLGAKEQTVFAGALKNSAYVDGAYVAAILWILEHGTDDGRIPPRPVLRYVAAEHRIKWNRQMAKLLQRGKTVEESLEILGEIMAGDIRDAMSRSSQLFEPNRPATVKAKGFDAPFKDTGHMIKSMAWELRKGSPVKKGQK